MGVGSEVYGAVINDRKGLGIELKTSYYRQAKANLDSINIGEIKAETVSLPFGGDDIDCQ
jgi:hypothetical protein